MSKNQILTLVMVAIILAGCTQDHAGSNVSTWGAIDDTAYRPNVILITINSLRADHVGCLGYHRNTTPNFDTFAQEGLLFTNAFASSGWMMPVHASLLTSLYPKDHGVTHISTSLSEQFYTLAEILRDEGYYGAGFSCNPRLGGEHGFGQGFDLYDDYSVDIMLESMALNGQEQLDINTSRTNDIINAVATRWLRNNTQRPFFLFVHYYDNHWDYLPPPPYDRMYDPAYAGDVTGREIAREPLFSNPPSDKDVQHIIALYDGEVKQTDKDMGFLLGYIKDNGLMKHSIVIVAGDHGEQFYEHGHTSHHGIYDELIHIPLAISLPDPCVLPAHSDALVSQLDILPTILDYLFISLPEQCQGKSLMPVIVGQVDSVNDYVFAEYTGGAAPDSWAVRTKHHKVYHVAGQEPHGFDLLTDPGEQDKIPSADFTEPLTQLYGILKEWGDFDDSQSN